MASLELTPSAVCSFAPGRVFLESGAPVVSLDFHRTDDLLLCAWADDSLRLVDVATGALLRTVLARPGGVGRACCTHAPLCVLVAPGAAAGREHSIRYHSLADNSHLRLFRGHCAPVTSLSLHPRSDAFLSAAADHTARLWDVRSPACVGAFGCGSARSPVAAYDAQGLVFAVATDPGLVRLFDAKAHDAGPFDTVSFAPALAGAGLGPGALGLGPGAPPPCATSLSFSLDGKLLLVVAAGAAVVLDAYSGAAVRVFVPPGAREAAAAAAAAATAAALAGAPPPPPPHPPCEAALTPCGRCLVMGCPDGGVAVWGLSGGVAAAEPACVWAGHAGVPAALRWHPTRALAASGCTRGGLALWAPPAHAPALQPVGSG